MTDQSDNSRSRRISKNIDLSFRLLEEIIDDPSRLDQIPDGSTVIVMPSDDPEQAAANLELADRLSHEGRTVRLQRIGVPTPDHPGWEANELRTFSVRTLRPRWLTDLDPSRLVVVYDAERDVLLVDLDAGRREGTALPMNGLTLVLVDLETEEAFGYLVPTFLSRAVRQVPRIAQILAAAELRPLREEELGGLEAPTPPDRTMDADLDASEQRKPPELGRDDLALMMQDMALLSA